MVYIKHHENLYNASNLVWFIVLYTVQECCKYYGYSTQLLHQNGLQKINYPSFPQYVEPVLRITAQYWQVGQMKTEPPHMVRLRATFPYTICAWYDTIYPVLQ
jgi:hypothetical protein